MIPQMLHLYSNILLKPRIFEGSILQPRASSSLRYAAENTIAKKGCEAQSKVATSSKSDRESKLTGQRRRAAAATAAAAPESEKDDDDLEPPAPLSRVSPSAEECQIDAVFSRLGPKLYEAHDYYVVYHSLMKLSQVNPTNAAEESATARCIAKSLHFYFAFTNTKLRSLLLNSMVV